MAKETYTREGRSALQDFYYAKKRGGRKISHSALWHSCFELIWVRSGKVYITIEGVEGELTEGDIAIIPQFALHSLTARGEDVEIESFAYSENIVYSLGLSVINMKYLTPFRYKSAASGFVIPDGYADGARLYRCLESIAEIQDSWEFGSELLTRAKFLEAHAYICNFFASRSGIGESVNSYLSGAEMYIENNISRTISPYEIAASLQISNSHLSKIIGSCLGCTTSELISRVKIHYVEKNMLTRGGTNVTDVAAELGYRSLSSFNRAFSKIRGCSPASFKKMYMPYDKAIL